MRDYLIYAILMLLLLFFVFLAGVVGECSAEAMNFDLIGRHSFSQGCTVRIHGEWIPFHQWIEEQIERDK